MFGELAARPRAMAALGALTIAFRRSSSARRDVAPRRRRSSAASMRCRCSGCSPAGGPAARPAPARARKLTAIAGMLFAVDLICWHHAIDDVGAGLATVLGNLQVALRAARRLAPAAEHPGGRVLAALPLVLVGIVLISGALEDGAYGDDPVKGVLFGIADRVSYADFLLVLRAGGSDLRRRAGPLFDATLVAAVACVPAGALIGEAELVPLAGARLARPAGDHLAGGRLAAHLASLPRLPAAQTSVLLTLQPVGSVLLGIVLLGEAPSGLQLLGVAAILAGLVVVAREGRTATGRPSPLPNTAAGGQTP